MRKLLLLLGISISFLSCDPDNFRIGGAPGVPGGCLYCCSDGKKQFNAFLYSSENCDGNPDVIEISNEELSRIVGIIKDLPEGECVFITVNPMDGSNPKQGYLKTKGEYFIFSCSV